MNSHENRQTNELISTKSRQSPIKRNLSLQTFEKATSDVAFVKCGSIYVDPF